MNLSKNFTLKEFCKSHTAIRYGIENNPDEAAIHKMQLLCKKTLQPIRDYLVKNYSAKYVNINSGFRCLELNRILKSSDASQHVAGEAADIEVPGIDNDILFHKINNNFDFDQLILEFHDPAIPNSGWIHISHSFNYNRQQAFRIEK